MTRAQLEQALTKTVLEEAEKALRVSDAREVIVSALLPLLSVEPTPPQWQPIETAPKDGTELLLWDGHDCSLGAFRGAAEWVAEALCFEEPTHWMPLPLPPAPAPAPTEGRTP